ncbi:MAG: TonB-dependent receptor plug domain-containing protein [Verrucomicrobia bacterium]|nr:TonB-dependent receptor plug domain-containing protein [Verrucomicrobiota bacterium]MDA1065226.1 TonB-dependent receptor plug domain-containing protein [Verrucomicrobiota bacterium]
MNAKKNKWLTTLVAIPAFGMAVGLPLSYAQEDDDNVFELNPFNVTEEENVGYLARSSLAGTRLNTPLRDIAATVSVITQEFLDDTGSTDLQELLVYTAGTEISGIGGNFANPDSTNVVSGVQEQNFRDPIRNTRVRGLARADLTRNYFSTVIAMDSYNTSRVVINRGANATLFGLGSPAGIINNQTITPLFENHGKLSFQFGSYDSHRSEIDVEQVLIEDKLSLRVAILNEERSYQQKPAFEHDARVFAVTEWRPFENTSLRASFESGSISANRPRTLPPQDLVSAWFLPGPAGTPKPTHNPYWGGGTNYQVPGSYVPDDLSTTGVNEYRISTLPNYFGFGGYTFEPVLVYDGPEFGVAGGALPRGVDGTVFIQPGGNRSRDFSNGANSQSFAAMRGTAENHGTVTAQKPDTFDQNGNSRNATRGFYTNAVVQDPTFFDFFNKLIDGPNKSELEWFDAFNLSLEQTFLEGNAGLSYQMNKEDYRSDFDAVLSIGSRFQGLGIDLNTHTRWGDVNPNFGRVWISGSRGFINTSEQSLENHRVTGFYKFDLSKFDKNDSWLGMILGSHAITGLYENSRDGSTSISYFQPIPDARFRTVGDGVRLNKNPATDFGVPNYAAAQLVYVSGSLADRTSSAGANVSNWKTKFELQDEYTLRYLNYDTGAYENGTFRFEERVAGSPAQNNNTIKQNIDIESKAIILQSRFLDDHLVANYGYREDEVDVFTNDNAPLNDDGSRNVNGSAWQLPTTPTFKSSSDSANWGVVAHVPDAWMKNLGGLGLSFHYAVSENSQIGQERVNLRGRNLAPVSGDTTEKGFTVEINDWLSIRYNEYETLQVGETSIGLTNSFRPLIQLYGNYVSTQLKEEVVDFVKENPSAWPGTGNPDDFLNFKPFDSPIGKDVASLINSRIDSAGNAQNSIPAALAFTSDLLSEGKEIEAVANITSNWRVMLNVTQQEVSATNTGGLLVQWINEEVNPNLAKYGQFPLSATGSETINNWLGRNAITAINLQLAQDGAKRTNEIREWRWNLVTNYEFDRDSKLAGFNVGGAYRWQDVVGIGRPLLVNPEGGFKPDLANPIYGPTQDRFDAWVGWERGIGNHFGRDTLLRVQLNVRNLLDDTDLIPVVADPDGGIPVVRIPDERTFELRASLSY